MEANAGKETALVLFSGGQDSTTCLAWALADRLGIAEVVVERTHTCYLGDRTHRHEWGYGCGACPACELRAAGWRRWRGAA